MQNKRYTQYIYISHFHVLYLQIFTKTLIIFNSFLFSGLSLSIITLFVPFCSPLTPCSTAMAIPMPFSLLIIFFSLSSLSLLISSEDLVRSSCVHASYPDICFRTLSSYAGPAKTPGDLAQAAVKVSLSRARKASDYLGTLRSGSKREQGALSDCIGQISDSIDDLTKTLSELKHLKSSSFRWQMNNVETWVSAALTNEDTCLDGFKEIDGKVRGDVKRKITNVARVTSNALYLINRLDQKRGKTAFHP